MGIVLDVVLMALELVLLTAVLGDSDEDKHESPTAINLHLSEERDV